MALNDLIIRNTKPLTKAYKLSDEKGLFLLVNPNGSRYWRLKHHFARGVYPEVKLAEAREKRDQARKLLGQSIDPVIAKQTIKNALILASENSFESIAREWHLKFSSGVSCA